MVTKLVSQIENFIQWDLLVVRGHIWILALSVLKLADVRIIVFVQNCKWNNSGRIPVMSDISDKIEILLPKQKLILPVFLIFKSNLLLNGVLRIVEFHPFLENVVLDHSLSVADLLLLVVRVLDFFVLVLNLTLILPLINDKVSISPLLVPHLAVDESDAGVLASKALIGNLTGFEVAHNVVVELIPPLSILGGFLDK